MKKGDSGDQVTALQNRLIDLQYLSGEADGKFGNGTAKALKDLQLVAGINETGVLDEETIKQLFRKSPRSDTYDYGPINRTVYQSRNSGKVYHRDPTCSGLKKPREHKLADAKRKGLRPCKICYK